ncbi:MAG: GNAT family N-acetyltransferase [Candidatus Omnitrophica bacterium]|nr:GNAT family N-acetyltransferase [Candidatus Omnitrophota bacterium]
MRFQIEPLGKRHERGAFSCGNGELDDWFRRRAGQDARRNIARIFVAVEPEMGIIGFYSLSAYTLSIEDLPKNIAHKLPNYDALPAALIGRLATDSKVQGKGVGKLLLADAIRRVLGAMEKLAVFAIVVEAKNEVAVSFYESFGFAQFPLHPNRLFLPTKEAISALGESVK